MGNTIGSSFSLPPTLTSGTGAAAKGLQVGIATPQDLLSLATAPKGGGEPSALARANQRGFETFADWNDKAGGVVGGALGIGVLIPALYVGVIGGAIAGGIAGLGFGPANAVLQGAHGLSFFGTMLSTGGAVAKAAVVAGTASGAVGGLVLGQKVGRMAAAVPIFAAAYPTGFAQGLASKDDPYQEPVDPQKPADPQKPVEPKKHERPGTITKTAQGLLGGAGLITGGIGGAAIGAGIGSGVALTSGLVTSTLSWGALGTGAAIGAVGAGIMFAGICGYGGYAIATGASKALSWAKDKIMPDTEKIALEQKRADVAKKEQQFQQLGTDVAQHTADADKYLKDQSAALDAARRDANTYIDGKEAEVKAKTAESDAYVGAAQAKLDARQADITAQDGRVEAAINGKADGIFTEIRKPTDEKYGNLGRQLDQKEAALRSRDDQVSNNERQQAATIEQKTTAAYDEKMKPVTAHYDELNGQQANREAQLNGWEGQIVSGNQALDAQVVAEGKTDFQRREPALEATYRQKDADLRRDYQGRTQQADAKAQGDLNALGQTHQTEMQQLEGKYASLTATASGQIAQLHGQASQLQSEAGQLQSQYQTAQYDERSAQTELGNAQSQASSVLGQARRERDDAVADRDRARNELSSVESQTRQAEAERNNLIHQKAQVDAQIPGLRIERDRLQSEVNKK